MVMTAAFGATIDSSGAKKGAQETNAAINSVGTAAERMAVQTAAAVKAVNRTLGEQANAYRGLLGAVNATTSATEKGTAALVAEVQAMRLLIGEMRDIAVAEQAVTAARTAGVTAIQAQTAAVGASSAAMTGAAGAMALVGRATTIATTAMGAIASPISIAMVAWQGLTAALDSFRAKKEKTAEELRDFRSELEKLGPTALQAAKHLEIDTQRRLQSAPPPSIGTASSRDLVNTWQANRNWNDWLAASQGRQAGIESEIGGRETKAIVELEKAMAGFARQSGMSKAALAEFRRGGEEAVTTFRTASAAWDASAVSTKTFAQALDEGDARAIRLRDSAAAAAREAAAMAKAQKDATDALKAQADEATRLVKVFAEMDDARRKYREQIADMGKSEDAAARKVVEQLTARRKAAKATADAILAAQGREMESVGMTADAYRQLRAELDLKAIVKQLEGIGIAGPDLAAFITVWKEQRTAIDANTAAVEAFREATARIGSTAAGWSQVADAVGGLVGQFGGLNAGIAEAIRGSADLAANISQAQRTGIYQKKDADGKLQTFNVGFGGALRGEAGAAGQFAAATSAIGMVTSAITIVKGISDAVDLFGDQARERERVIKERARAFNAALDEYAITTRTNLEGTLRQNIAGANQLASQLGVAGASFGTAADVNAGADYYQGMSLAARKDQRAEFRMMADALRKLSVEMQANEKIIRERAAAEELLATRDLDVRRLRAMGLDAEADAASRALESDRALTAAREQYGRDSSYVTKLQQVIAAEQGAAKAAQERADAEAVLTKLRQATDFGTDLAVRQQRRAGNEVGAFSIEQAGVGARAIREAEDLYKAGVISLSMLEQFKVVVGQEMADAVKRMVDQMAEAKRQVEEDLRVRALVAQGFAVQAEAERVTITNRRELAEVTDAVTRATIEHVHQLEAEARERARVAEIVAAHEAITKREIEALKILNPAKAAELEAQQKEIDRQKELASAADNVIRARLEELYVMEDQAAVMAKAAAASAEATKALQAQIEAQIAAANAFRDIQSTINDEWLRATGRGFEADRIKLGETRDQRIGSVVSSGLATLGAMPTVKGPWDMQGMNALAQWHTEYGKLTKQMQDNVDKINATHKANLDSLIASQFKPEAAPSASTGMSWNPGPAPAIPVLGEDTIAVRSARSITESSAMKLVDYSAAQLSVQREILVALQGRRGESSDLLGPTLDRIDRGLGARSRYSSMLVGGRIV